MKNILFTISTITALSLAAASCSKDDTPEPVEQELITTVQMIATPTGGGTAQTFNYKVQNGFGSTAPGTVQIDTVTLQAGASYNVELRVLNESESPAEDVTTEVVEERDEHLFFLEASPTGLVTVTDGSIDGQNRPFNQTFRLAPGTAGSGTFTITLLHEPTNKRAGTLAGAGGETDAQAIFPVVIRP